MTNVTENDLEQAALSWLADLGWQVAYGPDIAPDGPYPERASYDDVVLERRLRDALAELNPELPVSALEDTFRRLTLPEGSTLEARNRSFHRMLVDGVTVEYRAPDGNIRGVQAQVVDFENPANNDWLAVNQFTLSAGAVYPGQTLTQRGEGGGRPGPSGASDSVPRRCLPGGLRTCLRSF